MTPNTNSTTLAMSYMFDCRCSFSETLPPRGGGEGSDGASSVFSEASEVAGVSCSERRMKELRCLEMR